YTTFYAKVLSKDLPLAVDLLADIFLNSVFSSEEIRKERQVILQEIRMVDDTPDEYVQELLSRSFFHEHALSYPVLGDPETVSNLDRARMINFFREYYTSDRMIIAAVGKLKHDAVVKMIEENFGSVPKKDGDRTEDLPHPTPHILVKEKELEQVHLCFGSKGLSQTHPLRYASYVLNAVLGGGMSSRLFQEIREKWGLVYSVYSYMQAYFDTGLFTIYAGTDRDALKKVIQLVVRELKRSKTRSLSKKELHMAKEQLKGNLILASESTDNRMSRLAKSEIYFGRFIAMDEIISSIDRVTSDEVIELADEIFHKDYISLAVLGPVKEGDFTHALLNL
ncbi:MAG: pitrilysin family protein, partial [Pseudomonadota bacterium]